MASTGSSEFERFAASAAPRLLRAFMSTRGADGATDATSEALAYAFEHWDTIQPMENPIGYLYRVGQSRTRPRKPLQLPPPAQVGLPDIEPALVPALLELPETQRTAVWLVHACEWRYSEVAEAMGTTTSTVGTHVSRGLQRLRSLLEVESDA